MTQVIITNLVKQGTKTFRFSTLEAAMKFAECKLSRLVDILDSNNISILF